MSKITLERLTKKFGNVVAVNNMNLKVKDGEFLVLLGPSGCGKTTTLRLIAGLETPTSGNIYIGDRLVNSLSPKDRNVAMVFQSYALYPHMTVYDNLAFPLKAHKMPKEDIDKLVREIAEMLQICDLLQRKPRQLSGGQAQRVALGRALVRNPEVFLLDEPLSNLDAKLRLQMRAELQRLHQRLRITTIYVTHDQVEAMALGDRIALLNEGSIEQVGSPQELFNHPRNVFVACFIGSPSMNMLEGNIIEKDHGIIIDFGGSFTFEPSKDLSEIILEKAKSSRIMVGVRPQDIVVSNKKKPNAIKAELDVIQLLGSEMQVYLKIENNSIIAIMPPLQDLRIRKYVWFTFNEKKLHFFDKKSEEAIV